MASTRLCGHFCAVATLEDGSLIAVPIRCRSWDCDYCGRLKKRRLLRKLNQSRPNLFITLTTSYRTSPSPIDAFEIANSAIEHLFKRWKRRFPRQPFEYFLVWEKTRRGWPHAHILIQGPPVSKHWLSAQWKELTGSYVVDCQPLSDTRQAVAYLAKYLTKDPAVPPGHHRYRRSGRFFSPARTTPSMAYAIATAWQRRTWHPIRQALDWLVQGFAIQDRGDGVFTAMNDPPAHDDQLAKGWVEQLQTRLQHMAATATPI